MRATRWIVTALAGALAVGIGACGSDGGSSSDGGQRIGYVTATGVEYYTCVAKGLKAEVENGGNTYIEATYDPEKSGTELNAAEDLLAQGADEIVLLSTTPREGLAVIDRVKSEGKKVIAINSADFLEGDTSKVDATYVFDLKSLGTAAGELTADVVGSGAKAAAVEPAPGSGLGSMYDGYEAAVTAGGLDFVARVPADSYSPSDTQKATEDLLTQVPDVDVIYTDDSSATQGIIAALDSAGSDATVIPTGGQDDDKQKLLDGDYGAYSAVAAYPFGVGAGEVANLVAAGETVPAADQPKPVAITKDNVDEAPPYCAAA
jgi:ABC-type sugar transport system substrate-binding protein